MEPKEVETRQGHGYACVKCGATVGDYEITGSGENDWRFRKENFCHNCGEKVDWPEDRKKVFEQAVANIYSCGHVVYKIKQVNCFPEKYKETAIYRYLHECPLCCAKSEMDGAQETYERAKRLYDNMKIMQETGGNYCKEKDEEIQDRLKQIAKRMMEEFNGELDKSNA